MVLNTWSAYALHILCPSDNCIICVCVYVYMVFNFGFEISLYVVDTTPSSCMVCTYFLPVCRLSFHFLHMGFHKTKAFHFDAVLFISFYFMGHAFGVKSKNFLPRSRYCRFSLMFLVSCLRVLWFHVWHVSLLSTKFVSI